MPIQSPKTESRLYDLLGDIVLILRDVQKLTTTLLITWHQAVKKN
jgi:hypothetical protein